MAASSSVGVMGGVERPTGDSGESKGGPSPHPVASPTTAAYQDSLETINKQLAGLQGMKKERDLVKQELEKTKKQATEAQDKLAAAQAKIKELEEKAAEAEENEPLSTDELGYQQNAKQAAAEFTLAAACLFKFLANNAGEEKIFKNILPSILDYAAEHRKEAIPLNWSTQALVSILNKLKDPGSDEADDKLREISQGYYYKRGTGSTEIRCQDAEKIPDEILSSGLTRNQVIGLVVLMLSLVAILAATHVYNIYSAVSPWTNALIKEMIVYSSTASAAIMGGIGLTTYACLFPPKKPAARPSEKDFAEIRNHKGMELKG